MILLCLNKITCRYLRPAHEGDTIVVDAECLKIGKSLAFATVDICNKSDGGKLIAQGKHTKHIAQPFPVPNVSDNA